MPLKGVSVITCNSKSMDYSTGRGKRSSGKSKLQSMIPTNQALQTGRSQRLSIQPCKSKAPGCLSHGFFVPGVKFYGISPAQSNNAVRIRIMQCRIVLRLPDQRPLIERGKIMRIMVIRQLDEIKFKFPIAQGPAPVFQHSSQKRFIFFRHADGIGFALIPQNSTHRDPFQRQNHIVIEHVE